jgi:hypothetical protein
MGGGIGRARPARIILDATGVPTLLVEDSITS